MVVVVVLVVVVVVVVIVLVVYVVVVVVVDIISIVVVEPEDIMHAPQISEYQELTFALESSCVLNCNLLLFVFQTQPATLLDLCIIPTEVSANPRKSAAASHSDVVCTNSNPAMSQDCEDESSIT